jgi:hypothetical protein
MAFNADMVCLPRRDNASNAKEPAQIFSGGALADSYSFSGRTNKRDRPTRAYGVYSISQSMNKSRSCVRAAPAECASGAA